VSQSFKAVKVSNHVSWVGAIDWTIRDFHGYSTERGSTYNAYLVLADEVTLIDTVKAPFKEELLSRISSVIDPKEIRYIVSNHSEMDHSGCLPEIIDIIKPEKVFASPMGVKALSEHFHMAREIVPVKEGESISLGNANLSFMETRMLHWPDSMFTYLAEDRLLFSQDAFGMHLASSERFADEIESWVLEYEGTKYYANILLPFSPLVTKLLEKVRGLNIAIDTIAPDHGPIWRKDIRKILEFYEKWAAQKPKNKAVIVYDTMWQSTAKLAQAIGEGLASSGASVKLMSLKSNGRSDVAKELLDAGALLVGSPTINGGMFPSVADLLTYLAGLKPKNLIGAVFGSYGWSGEAVERIKDSMTGMKVELVGDPVKVKYVPDNDALAECYSLGVQVARRLKEVVNALG
jgi:flavorubredoxin